MASTKSPLKRRKALLIYWEDPTSYAPWQTIKEASSLSCAEQWSLGWLVHEDKDKLVLALTFADEREEVSDKIVLPQGCIKSRVEVKI